MNTPEMNAKLLKAIRYGEAAQAAALLDAGADANACDEQGRTALIYAASISMSNVRRAEIVLALLAHKADPDKSDPWGVTPLHEAAVSGQWEVITALVDKGANINAQSQSGATPLHTAAAVAMGTGRTETVSFLLEHGANSAFRDNAGRTALEMARKNKSGGMYASTVASVLSSWDEARPGDVRRAEVDAATQREQREAALRREAQLREISRKAAPRLKLKP